jgi:2,3-dihydroxy-p-cumate/2,3-dihydroxybenzoate 3,4-dioxygenase
MIAIEQLQYVRLPTADLAMAVDFAQCILGLQLTERTEDEANFRSDFRDPTLVYFRGQPEEQAVGLEVRSPEALERAAEALAAHGLKIEWGSAEAAQARKVKSFLSFVGHSGNRFELVVRPMHSGWRFFPSRDAGVTGLEAVALRTTVTAEDEAMWRELFGAKVSDWVGNAAYMRFGHEHHRLALHPSDRAGVLAVEFGVENVDLFMQNSYFLQASQVSVVHGPGRRPTSNQLFLTFAGPDGIFYSYVSEGEGVEDSRRPRQFPRQASSFCVWGSESKLPEFRASGSI